jgi:hypothetical protein
MSKSRIDFQSMPTNELLLLFEDLAATLTDRMAAEKSELTDRLRQLNGPSDVGRSDGAVLRRPYIH